MMGSRDHLGELALLRDPLNAGGRCMSQHARQCVHKGVHWCCYDTLDQYHQDRESSGPMWPARHSWSGLLKDTLNTKHRYPGHCGVCGTLSEFTSQTKDHDINLREALVCSSCELNARLRAAFNALSMHCPSDERQAVYLTEQATPFYRAVKQTWPNVKGSEYFPKPAYERLSAYVKHLLGEHEWLRWEDVCALSFKDQSIDHLVCLEVLEHVPHYEAALLEFARVLKPGGRLIITVPFLDVQYATLVRARVLSDGQIEHLEPPEYHGDPVDGEGILAFYHFGWDLLDQLKRSGFQHAQWCLPWAPAQGLFDRLWTLIATR